MEKMAITNSDYLISDNKGIQNYYLNTHNINSYFLAYGADIPINFNKDILKLYNVKEYDFSLVLARLEPENSIEIILEGFLNSKTNNSIIVIEIMKLIMEKNLKICSYLIKIYVSLVFT